MSKGFLQIQTHPLSTNGVHPSQTVPGHSYVHALMLMKTHEYIANHGETDLHTALGNPPAWGISAFQRSCCWDHNRISGNEIQGSFLFLLQHLPPTWHASSAYKLTGSCHEAAWYLTRTLRCSTTMSFLPANVPGSTCKETFVFQHFRCWKCSTSRHQ